MNILDSFKSFIGPLFSKKGGHFKLWLAILACSGPLALAADGHSINTRTKSGVFTITPPETSADETEQANAAVELSTEEDESDPDQE